jgi:hypothetical protein
MEIRSFRAVFDLERRVYRVDTVRLNPGGIPLRGVLYTAALVPACLVAGRIPPASWVLGFLPWYVRYLGLPVIIAALATIVRIDGRPFHHAARAIATHCVAPRWTCGVARAQAPGARWRPPTILVIPDGSDARFRRLRYRGPGAVMVGYAHDRAEWSSRSVVRSRADLTIHPRGSGRPLVRAVALELASGAVLEVCPSGGSAPAVARASARGSESRVVGTAVGGELPAADRAFVTRSAGKAARLGSPAGRG